MHLRFPARCGKCLLAITLTSKTALCCFSHFYLQSSEEELFARGTEQGLFGKFLGLLEHRAHPKIPSALWMYHRAFADPSCFHREEWDVKIYNWLTFGWSPAVLWCCGDCGGEDDKDDVCHFNSLLSHFRK